MPETSIKERTYQWFIGVILGLLFATAGALVGSNMAVDPLKDDLRAHESLPAHPVSEQGQVDMNRRLTRMENKLDQVLDRLPPSSRNP